MSETSHLRRLNRRRALEHVTRAGAVSRAQLGKATGLSAPTAGKVVDELLAAGLLEEVEGGSGGAATPGRPGRPVRLNRTEATLVAVQIGVRRTRLAALPVSGPIDDRWKVQFPTPRRPETWLKHLRKAGRRLRLPRPKAVTVSIPGVVDEAVGRVLLAPNLHWIEQADLVQLVGKVWRSPVCLVQEIMALAMGHVAAEPEDRDFLLVDFDEGVGGAVMIGGRPYAPPLPLSGELGHTPVAGGNRLCGCGAIGCIETLTSRRGLVASFAAAHPSKPRTWRSLAAHVRRAGVEPWLAATLESMAMTIAGAINVLGVRRVLITGSLTELPPIVVEHLSEAVERSAMWARFGQVLCRAAPRRRAAGLAVAAIDRILLPAEPWRVGNVGPKPQR